MNTNELGLILAALFAVFTFALMIPTAILVFWLAIARGKEMQRQAQHKRDMEQVTLYPDFQGNYPARITQYGVIVLELGNYTQPTPHSFTYSPHITASSDTARPQIVNPILVTELPPTALPTAPSLAELVAGGWRPTRQRMLLGFNLAGPIYGAVSDLLSVGIAGRPGQGKSTLLRFIFWQVVTAGGRALVLDPHGSILEDVTGAPVDFEASSGEELNTAAAWMVQELETRLEQRREGKRVFTPMLALCDELPVISLSSKAASGAIGRVVLEGRKVSMFALISGQGLPAENFGGRLVRDALSSRYVFKTSNAEAQRAGLDKETARLVDQLEPGRAILAGIVEPGIVAIPNLTGADLELLTGSPTNPLIYDGGVIPPPGPKTTVARDGGGQSLEDRAALAWKEGANSVRKLAVALGVTRYQAEQLIRNLGLTGEVSD